MGEFDLIARYFQRPNSSVKRAVLGIGDDCALLQPQAGMQLAISSDMLLEGRHFLSTVPPFTLGHKALAVNLSDLAACGAQPLAFTLALALPQANPSWLAAFSDGLFSLADLHNCELIGGDTTQGALNICITIFGETPSGQSILRSGAQADDDIYVSGNLGDARLALEVFRGTHTVSPEVWAVVRNRLEQPTPRIALGLALRGIANAAIDISDGLLGDLAHLLRASGKGAKINTAAVLPCMAVSAIWDAHAAPISPAQQLQYVLAGGDDYELAFTAPVREREAVALAAQQSNTPITRIGTVQAEAGMRLLDASGSPMPHNFASFDHFAPAL